MKTVLSIKFVTLAAASFLLFACNDARPATAVASAEALQSGEHASGKASDGVRFGTARCDQCLGAHCNPDARADPLLAECLDQECERSFACFQRNRCASSFDSVPQCFCGVGVSTEACLANGFQAQGPCAPMLQDAVGSKDTRVVFGMMYSSANPVGNGAALFRCAAEHCVSECVTDPTIPPRAR